MGGNLASPAHLSSFSEPNMHASFLTSPKELFFDGLCGSVIGVIAMIAVQILKASVEGALDRVKDKTLGEAVTATAQVRPAAVLYALTLAVLYKFTNKYTPPFLVIAGGVAGQFLFVDL